MACYRVIFTFAKVVEKNETYCALLKRMLSFECFYSDAVENSRLWGVALTERRCVASQKTGFLEIKPRGLVYYAM